MRRGSTLPPQGVLSVNMRDATNVNSFNARFDMLRPATAQATNLDVESREDQQARGRPARGCRRWASRRRWRRQQQRRVLLSQTGLARTGELQTYAQAVVDRSALAITAEGELNTVAYGGLLRAKRPVMVRGAGQQFSGTYYVRARAPRPDARFVHAELHPAAQRPGLPAGIVRGQHGAAGIRSVIDETP